MKFLKNLTICLLKLLGIFIALWVGHQILYRLGPGPDIVEIWDRSILAAIILWVLTGIVGLIILGFCLFVIIGIILLCWPDDRKHHRL